MKSTKCIACGFVGFSDETCKACGAPMNQRSDSAPPVAPVYGSQHHYGNDPEGQKKGMAIAAYRKFGTLEELAASNLLDARLSTGEKNGYQFTIVVESPETFEVNAVPTTYRSSGLRSFYVDESTVVRGGNNFGGPASKVDEPLTAESEFQRRRNNRPANYRGDDRY